MHLHLTAPRALAAVSVLGVALTGCGDKVLSTSDAENLVRKGVKAAGAGKAQSVSCPDKIKAEVGHRFKCTAKVPDGDPITFTINVDKVDGDNGHMTIVGARQGSERAGEQ